MYYSPSFSLHFTKGYGRYKRIEEVENNLMELKGSKDNVHIIQVH